MFFLFQAVEELFKLMELFVMKHTDSTEQDIHEINTFRKHTMQLYLQVRVHRTILESTLTFTCVLLCSFFQV